MTDATQALAAYGIAGVLLIIAFGVIGCLGRDLMRQRDRALDGWSQSVEAIDELTDANEATQEMVRTTNTLLQDIQRARDRAGRD